MKNLPILLVLLILFLPLFFVPTTRANNTAPIFENIYLRVVPSDQDGVIDMYYKNKFGNWAKYNSLTVTTKNDQGESDSQTDQVSYVTEQLTDGLSSRPDLTKAKFQFNPMKNGSHIYLIMEMEVGKPFVKFSAFKNTDSAEVKEVAIAYTNGLQEFTQKIQINGLTYDSLACASYTPGCNDVRTIKDGAEVTLIKPGNRIMTLISEVGSKQLMFYDQELGPGDKLTAIVKTSGASKTKSLATPSAQRREETWFQTVKLARSPFNGDTNNWYFGINTESVLGVQSTVLKEKRNISFKIKFFGVEKNIGDQSIGVVVKNGASVVLNKKVTVVGTSSGVYVGTIENLPGKNNLEVYLTGPKHLTSKFGLPVGQESMDWTSTPLRGGDANLDGVVDSIDFALMQRDYLQNIVSVADFNFDIRVDALDFAILKNSYQSSSAKP